MKIAFTIFSILVSMAVKAQPGAGVEASGLVQVRAKISSANGQPVSGAMTYLSVIGEGFDLRTAESDENGELIFLLSRLPEKGRLIFQVNPEHGNALQITTATPLVSAGTEDSTRTVYEYFDTTAFYGKPDASYLLDEYTRFATMEEVFREFVTEVRVSRQGNNYRLNVFNKPFKTVFENDPLILLDGIPLFDVNRLMELDPLKIRSIDVVARKYYLGKLLNYGVIALYSFDGDMAGYTLPEGAKEAPFSKP